MRAGDGAGILFIWPLHEIQSSKTNKIELFIHSEGMFVVCYDVCVCLTPSNFQSRVKIAYYIGRQLVQHSLVVTLPSQSFLINQYSSRFRLL